VNAEGLWFCTVRASSLHISVATAGWKTGLGVWRVCVPTTFYRLKASSDDTLGSQEGILKAFILYVLLLLLISATSSEAERAFWISNCSSYDGLVSLELLLLKPTLRNTTYCFSAE